MPAEESLSARIESVLFVAGGPVEIRSLARALDAPASAIETALELLATRLTHGIRLQVFDGRAQLASAPENAETIRRFVGFAKPAPLSRAALEVLAVVAYRQPVTRPEIEAVRGVQSDRVIHTLLSRGLIEELGERPGPGRPHEYGTTFEFLQYFGLSSLEELPPLPETPPSESVSIGMRAAKGD